ncbi:MAG: aspartate aminotransferase family protein [Chloroflexaceae bacterium]|nr:aspartate aminotransferase family protein [Chloroflexaceae bacterium]
MQQQPTTATAIQTDKTYLLQLYQQPDFVIERGEGMYLYDMEGRRYLDFVSGIAVNALGYGDSAVVQAIAEQAAKLMHTSGLYHTRPAGELAKALVERTPVFQRVYFGNSGTEVIEAALKFSRKFARTFHGEGKTGVVAFDGSFHGRTMGSVALTATEKYRLPFMPVMPDVRFAQYNDIASIEATITDDVCAVFVEPVQGEGGLRVVSDAFMHRLRELCDQHSALLVLDEIQCGMGRTGTLWAHEPYGVRPDMMAIAKPLAGGMPIGALLLNECVAEAISYGDHGTTFGGGPLATTVAKVVFDRISDPAFLERVREVSSYLDEALHDFAAERADTVIELRGRGLMRGLKIHGSAADVRMRGHDAGVLLAVAGADVVRMLPPLIVEPQHIDEVMAVLREIM